MSDKAAVMAALVTWVRANSIQDDDVTVADVMSAMGCVATSARKYMKDYAEAHPGEIELIKLPDSQGHKILVLRKI